MVDVTLAELAGSLIATFEGAPPVNAQGLYLPFRDGGGIWTCGRGHTSGVTISTPPATQEQVDRWFAADQAPLLSIVQHLPVLEAAAWASFGFNCGISAMEACLAGHGVMQHYIHDAKNNVEPGLVTRRLLESLLIQLSQQLHATPDR